MQLPAVKNLWKTRISEVESKRVIGRVNAVLKFLAILLPFSIRGL
jgi:hypothetical protein